MNLCLVLFANFFLSMHAPTICVEEVEKIERHLSATLKYSKSK